MEAWLYLLAPDWRRDCAWLGVGTDSSKLQAPVFRSMYRELITSIRLAQRAPRP